MLKLFKRLNLVYEPVSCALRFSRFSDVNAILKLPLKLMKLTGFDFIRLSNENVKFSRLDNAKLIYFKIAFATLAGFNIMRIVHLFKHYNELSIVIQTVVGTMNICAILWKIAIIFNCRMEIRGMFEKLNESSFEKLDAKSQLAVTKALEVNRIFQ